MQNTRTFRFLCETSSLRWQYMSPTDTPNLFKGCFMCKIDFEERSPLSGFSSSKATNSSAKKNISLDFVHTGLSS